MKTKKILATACTLLMILTTLNGCVTQTKCTYCDSTNIKYKAVFFTGTIEYLCENCYGNRNENPTFDDYWKVTPID